MSLNKIIKRLSYRVICKILKDFIYFICQAFVRDSHFSDQSRSNHNSNDKKNNLKNKSNTSQRNTTSVFLTKATPTPGQEEVKHPSSPVKNAKLTLTAGTSSPVSPSVVPAMCGYCSEEHSISHCLSFENLSLSNRVNFTKSHRWYFYHLKSSHVVKNCKSTFRCQKCCHRHHTRLHPS